MSFTKTRTKSRERSVSLGPNKRSKPNSAVEANGNSVAGDDGGTDGARLRYCVHANDVIFLKAFRSSLDVQSDNREVPVYHPKFTSQIFEGEEIVGYESPRVDIYFTAGSMRYFLRVSYQSKARGGNCTDIEHAITSHMQAGSIYKREVDFVRAADEKFVPPLNDLLQTYVDGDGRKFELFKGSLTPSETFPAASVDKLRSYHQRLQLHTLLSIDGASVIDTDDARWEMLMIFEKVAEDDYLFVGYAAVYPFLGVKEGGLKEGFSERVQISQFLIMPRYHRQGHGGRLLEVIYDDCRKRGCLEITVESASEGFRHLRDTADLRNCLDAGLLGSENTVLSANADPAVLAAIHEKLRITRSQAVRCFEMNLLRNIEADDDVRKTKLRLMVKRRLYREFSDVLSTFTAENRKIKLAELYDDLESEYRVVLKRLSKLGISCPCLGM